MTTMLDRFDGLAEATSVDDVFRGGHTAYDFTSEPVTPEQLDRIADLIRFPPTAMNIQPLRVVLVRSDEAKARLLPYLARGNQAKSAAAPVVAILAADTNFHDYLPRLAPHAPQARDRFADDQARERTARFNATLQAGYFILAVRAAGLDAGPMGGFDAEGIDRDLLGDGPLKSFMIVNIGHVAPGGTYPRSPRLATHEVFSEL
jgi:3-hydroxypropanoate dehydrogenase